MGALALTDIVLVACDGETGLDVSIISPLGHVSTRLAPGLT